MSRTAMFRRYGLWAGNPLGYREDRTRCIAEVGGGGAWGRAEARQCTGKRGQGPDGLYCKRHAAMVADGRGVVLPALREMRVKETSALRTAREEDAPMSVSRRTFTTREGAAVTVCGVARPKPEPEHRRPAEPGGLTHSRGARNVKERERRISACSPSGIVAVFCYGPTQAIGEPIPDRRYVTWRMDYGRHAHETCLYFPSLTQARADVARRLRFYRSMMRLQAPQWRYGKHVCG